MSDFELLENILSQCEARGAKAAVRMSSGQEWSTQISGGEVELHEAASSNNISIKCYLDDGRNAGVSTNDFNKDTLTRLANEAVDLAEAGAADEWQGLADAHDCGLNEIADLDDGGEHFDEEQAVQLILDAERLAKEQDKRIIASHRSGVNMHRGESWFATSNDVRQHKHSSTYSAQLVIVAEQEGEKQMGYSWTANRNFKLLRDAQTLADEAVDKAVSGYNWKQAPTGTVNVIFNNEIASQILGLVSSLSSGNAVYRGSTCWADKLGEQVAHHGVHVYDDPLIPGALGSRTSDSSGVKTKRTDIIKDGVLQCFLTDVYSARRLQQPLTAHGGGCGNVRLSPGTMSEDDLLKSLGTGFYVTGLQGHGVDPSSGHWSKGAQGFWIENGERSYPVQNVTLAGNMTEMFKNLEGIADNPRPEASTSSPSILIKNMQLGGSD